MGNLHGLLQLLSRASGVVSGRLADVLSPARHAAAAAAPLPQARRASQHSASKSPGIAFFRNPSTAGLCSMAAATFTRYSTPPTPHPPHPSAAGW